MITNMIEAILNIIGPYTPVTYTDIRYHGDVEYSVQVIGSGLGGIDYPWIVSAIIFIGMLYLTYKILYLFIPKIHRF